MKYKNLWYRQNMFDLTKDYGFLTLIFLQLITCILPVLTITGGLQQGYICGYALVQQY